MSAARLAGGLAAGHPRPLRAKALAYAPDFHGIDFRGMLDDVDAPALETVLDARELPAGDPPPDRSDPAGRRG
jgi:hypothetical protein